MLKLFKSALVALLGLGMASAMAQTDPRFGAFMQTVSGNSTTVKFGGGGVPVATSAAPLGTPSVQAMGFTRTAEGVFMESNGFARVPGSTTTVPVNTKLKLSGQVIGKTLAKAALAVTLWQAGSALYDIWSDAGLEFSDGVVLIGTGGGSSVNPSASFSYSSFYSVACRSGTVPASSYASHSSYISYVKSLCDGGIAPNTGSYNWVGSVSSSSIDFQILRTSNGTLWGGQSVSFASSCPANSTYNGTDCTCNAGFTPSGAQCTTVQRVATEQEIVDLIAQQSGWPDSTIADALADALKLPGIQPVIAPDIEAQPAADTQVQIQGAPSGVTIGDPVTTETTTTNPDGTTSTTTKTTTTTVTPDGNKLVKTQDTVTTVTVKDAQGNPISTTTTTTTTAQTPTTAAEGEDLECGLPDTPACRIDETGTPEPPDDDGESRFWELVPQCLQDDWKSCFPEFPDVNWTFSFPSGCSPISLGAFEDVGFSSVDLCQFQSTIHDLMSMVWAAAGLFGAVALISRRPGNGGA